MPLSVHELEDFARLEKRILDLEVKTGVREAPPPPLTPEQAEAKRAAEVLSALSPESRAFLANILTPSA